MSLRGFERVSSRASQVNDDVNIKLRVSESSLLFSPDASAAIGNPAYAVILLNKRSHSVAVVPADKGDDDAIRFAKAAGKNVRVALPQVLTAVSELIPVTPVDGRAAFTDVKGEYSKADNAILFHAKDGVAGSSARRGRAAHAE